MTSEARVMRRRRAAFSAAALATLSLFAPSCAKSADRWCAELADADPYVRTMAAIGCCIEAPERASEALPTLLELLQSPDADLRRVARRVLAEIASRNPTAVLDVALHRPGLDPDVRKMLNAAIPRAREAAVPALVAAMHDGTGGNPRMLAGILAEIGAPALDPLLDLFEHDPNPFVRASAAWAIGEIGPRAERALPSLIDAVEHEEVVVARVALASVAHIDAGARRALPLLRASLARPEKYMREAAGDALVHLHLARAASRPDDWSAAARDVVLCGDAGWAALVEALDEKDSAAERFARQCLLLTVARIEIEHALRPESALAASAVDTRPLEAQPSMQAITGRDVADSPIPRGLAILALTRCGERSLPFLPLLGYALSDSAPSARWCAALAILAIALECSEVLARCGPWSSWSFAR